MIEFRKILCPVDLENTALWAVEYARDIAQKDGATLYLLNVARIPAADMDTPIAIGAHPHWELAAQSSLQVSAAEWLKGTVAYEVIVRAGIPETVIVEVAAELDVDLIVMSTHGRTGIVHFILGSVAETIIREARCPVLIVKPRHG